MYLQALQDRTTNSINLPVRDVIQYLYDMYGDISPDLLAKKQTEVEVMTFDPSLPMDVLFTAIEQYIDIVELVGARFVDLPTCGALPSERASITLRVVGSLCVSLVAGLELREEWFPSLAV